MCHLQEYTFDATAHPLGLPKGPPSPSPSTHGSRILGKWDIKSLLPRYYARLIMLSCFQAICFHLLPMILTWAIAPPRFKVAFLSQFVIWCKHKSTERARAITFKSTFYISRLLQLAILSCFFSPGIFLKVGHEESADRSTTRQNN